MPKLPQFDAGNAALQPTERGVDARLVEARRTSGFHNEAAGMISAGAQSRVSAQNDVDRSFANDAEALGTFAKQQEDFAGHREVSAGAAASAKLFDKLNDDWNNTVKNADPNDPSVAAKFRDTVLEPSLQQFNDAYSNTDRGRQWSEQHVESMRNHFFQKTASDMSTLAGDAVAVNVRNLGNSSSNTARKNGDPHTVDFLLGQVDSSVGQIIDSSPNLKGAAAAKARMQLTEQMKEQIVKAGVIGGMEKSADPEAVAKMYGDKYPQYINAQEIDQFAKIAKYYKTIATSESRAARVQGDYLAKQDFHQKVNALEASTMPEHPGDPPQLPQDYYDKLRNLSTHPGAALEPGRLKTMADNGAAIEKRLNAPEPLGRISHDTTMQIVSDIRSGKITDTGPIYDLYGQGKLNRADFNFAVNEVRNLKTPEGAALGDDRKEFFKRYAATVDGAMDTGGHSALGSQRMYQFEMDARRQENDLRKSGQDPHSLYDPSSPNFIGKSVAKYHVSFQEAQAFEKQVQGERAAQGAAAPPARNTNLTGTGKDSSVVSVDNKFVPPANWDYSESRKQYRDKQGKIYGLDGKPVK